MLRDCYFCGSSCVYPLFCKLYVRRTYTYLKPKKNIQSRSSAIIAEEDYENAVNYFRKARDLYDETWTKDFCMLQEN